MWCKIFLLLLVENCSNASNETLVWRRPINLWPYLTLADRSHSSSSSRNCHAFGLFVDPSRSHLSNSPFSGLPWFLAPIFWTSPLLCLICFSTFCQPANLFLCQFIQNALIPFVVFPCIIFRHSHEFHLRSCASILSLTFIVQVSRPERRGGTTTVVYVVLKFPCYERSVFFWMLIFFTYEFFPSCSIWSSNLLVTSSSGIFCFYFYRLMNLISTAMILVCLWLLLSSFHSHGQGMGKPMFLTFYGVLFLYFSEFPRCYGLYEACRFSFFFFCCCYAFFSLQHLI
jgi:hypothetical protein